MAKKGAPDSLGEMYVLDMSARVGQTEKRVKRFES